MALAMVWIFFRIIQLPLAFSMYTLPLKQTNNPALPKKEKEKIILKKQTIKTNEQIETAMYLHCIYALLRLFRVTLWE